MKESDSLTSTAKIMDHQLEKQKKNAAEVILEQNKLT
jgi:ubiquinone biosynthesis protein UbiJ